MLEDFPAGASGALGQAIEVIETGDRQLSSAGSSMISIEIMTEAR